MSKTLKKNDPRDMQIGGFMLTATSVNIAGKPTHEEWQQAMQFVDRAATACMWWHGDMLNYGYMSYGELASQEEGDNRYDLKSLQDAKYVCSKVQPSVRTEKLSFGHHKVVAPLPAREQKQWLKKAATGEWSISTLRKETADARAAKELADHPLPDGKHSLIYADPPWRYDFSVSDSRKIENHYPTMEVEDICGMEVGKLASDDCILFLWATSPKLNEAFQVIESWGFGYKTCMVWRKDKIGNGYYARQQHELLLIATRGLPGQPLSSSRPPSVVDAPRGSHSSKPEVFYDLIETMYPKSTKVELFCREPRKGWKSWGNEV